MDAAGGREDSRLRGVSARLCRGCDGALAVSLVNRYSECRPGLKPMTSGLNSGPEEAAEKLFEISLNSLSEQGGAKAQCFLSSCFIGATKVALIPSRMRFSTACEAPALREH